MLEVDSTQDWYGIQDKLVPCETNTVSLMYFQIKQAVAIAVIERRKQSNKNDIDSASTLAAH